MPAPPPVSIGLPVYNGEPFLAQTLDDLLGQTFGDFELVVCDNASTDATPDLLAEVAAQDSRVVVVRNETNIGALPNTNKAFALARGDRYVLSAHDDRHAPDFLARLVAALDDDPGAAVAYGDDTLIDEAGHPLAFYPEAGAYRGPDGARLLYDRGLLRPLPDDPVARYRAVLASSDVNAPIYGLFRREVLERIGPHQIHGSDRLVVAHAALLGRFAYVPEPLFGYRIHAGSTLHLTREEWIERDTGARQACSSLDGVRTFRRYLGAVAEADLTAGQRLRAARATLGYAVRPEVLGRLVVPGTDNYWGWTPRRHRGGPLREHSGRRSAGAADDGRWGWMTRGEPAKDFATVES